MTGPDDLVASALYVPEPETAGAARGFVRDTLRSWGLLRRLPDADRLMDDAVLLTSELVTNAVVHAGTQVEVVCTLSHRELEVAVRDRHPARTLPDGPAHGVPDDGVQVAGSSERGRGLLLPAALASCWGVTYASTAKTVWFRLTLTGDSDDGRGSPSRQEELAAPTRGDEPVTVAPVASGVEPIPALRRDLGTLGFNELLTHTVETARDAVTADAAYLLLADEDGELHVRSVAGIGVSDELGSPSVPTTFNDGSTARSVVTVPFVVDGRVTGVLGAASVASEAFGDEDTALLQRVADRVAMSVERARLSALERARRGRIGFLAEASELLASTLDREQTISLIAQLLVPRLATWCAVLLADDTGALHPSYVWHSDESRIDPLAGLLEQTMPSGVPEAGRRWSFALPGVAALPEDSAALAGDAAWSFPLVARGRSLGMVVIGRRSGERLAKETLELAEDLARRAALALDNARLYEQQQLTSRALQRSLLPPALPKIPGIDLAVAHEVAGEGNEVGGDFYDIFPAGDHRWRFAIGDVCGTGPEAAAVTGLARHTLRILAREGYDVAEVVGRLNDLILEEGTRDRFVTLLHGEIALPTPDGSADRPSGARLSLVCAGHPLPLLLRAADRVVDAATPLPSPAVDPQPLLGVLGDQSFHTQSVDLTAGDVLLCVTDGITERRGGSRLLDDDGGLARLLAGCGGLNAGAVAAKIQRAVDEFGAGLPADDMALLVLRAL